MVTISCDSIEQRCNKDRMSDLPESIILHILSFMDAKDAVRSGILSKRYAYLWTEAPCLNFKQSTMEIINTTVYFHKRINLEKVSVRACRDGESSADREIKVCRIIRLLGFAKVKELVLELDRTYRLPQHFYWNPTLKKLTLTRSKLRTNGFVNWKSLQSLSLTDVLLPSQIMNNIISGCPSMELLVLSKCYCFSSMDLTNNRCLRKLVIDECYTFPKLKISAPSLQSLVLLRYREWLEYKFLNINSLTDCCLDFYEAENLVDHTLIKDLTSLLKDLFHIEAITIGERVIQILSLMELNELPCPMSKTIKFLKLSSYFTAHDMTGVAYLLRNLNRLEKLVLEIRDYDGRHFVSSFPKQYQVCLNNKSYCLSGIMENLKTVGILGLNEYQDMLFPYDLDNIFLLAEFLLKNAKFLENMTITAQGSMHYLIEWKNKLLSFPRSSPSAIVKIIDC